MPLAGLSAAPAETTWSTPGSRNVNSSLRSHLAVAPAGLAKPRGRGAAWLGLVVWASKPRWLYDKLVAVEEIVFEGSKTNFWRICQVDSGYPAGGSRNS